MQMHGAVPRPVVLFASNNSAKVDEARKFFNQVDLRVVSLLGTKGEGEKKKQSRKKK
jgi:hypothetical protein